MAEISEWLGYLASFIAHFFLLVLLLILWRGRLQGVWLIQALLFGAMWSGYFAYSAYVGYQSSTNVAFAEILHASTWVLFLWKLHSVQHGVSDRAFWQTPALRFFLFAVLGTLFFNLLHAVKVISIGKVSIELLAPFALVICCLVLLEQWYRNIKRENRWNVKFLALGLLGMFVYDFVLFSEALLFDSVDPALWTARGWVTAFMIPFLAVSVARTNDWEQPLRVSHQAAFYTTSVLLAGCYLLIMAAAGYYLRWFGGSWGGALQIIFVVLSLSLLVLLLASGAARGTLSVWLSKHFFAYKYDYREEWSKANNSFAQLKFDDSYYEELIKAIATPVDSMGGWMWCSNEGQLRLKSSWSVDDRLDIGEQEDTTELMTFLTSSGWIIELDEYQSNRERYNGLTLPTSLDGSEDLWLLIPLLHQNTLQGVIGLRNPRSNRSINWEDYDLLKALGGQIATLIAFRHASEALTEARQFEAFNRLSAFVVHDLKNIVAQLSLVVTNAERHKHNPEFVDDALDTLANAVARMNRLLSQLRQQSQLNINASVVEPLSVLKEVVQNQKLQAPPVTLIEADVEGSVFIEKERLVSVLCHLVQNAQEATPDDGFVKIGVEEDSEHLIFTVEDNGSGMDESFIKDRLFKPFDTTKGSAGMGVGVYETQQFIQQNGGAVKVNSHLGEGTCFRILLPKHKSQ